MTSSTTIHGYEIRPHADLSGANLCGADLSGADLPAGWHSVSRWY